ncbi:dihydropteroate synthase [Legionella worsleiensis]|uniref:Dihydropteroate synthase n=1 Tax=Legionella worsleiensis TaxID=45076 RepID=A0A0W1AEX6_9GAMM|nr:dihydropteroate synthase [Legionella worsleiensis]KTD79882.1 7,8-dihydropteroate synthase [Legionella worsleiensis]STY32394.1 dihydropteroate synthase [Legionella worsleiensis]
MTSEDFISWLEQKSQLESNSGFQKPLIMGILNVTSDSFSDGGCYLSHAKAYDQAFNLIAQGADIIDIGGESTKPGACEVSLDEELARVIPLIEQIRKNSDICISIDTYKPQVMKHAVCAGANIINDVYALRKDGALAMAAQLNVPVCLMHMQGDPQNMQNNPAYPDGVMVALKRFFSERMIACENAGIDKQKLIIDPGFGFGKRVDNNLSLMNKIDELTHLYRPILLGVSRKSTIGAILDKKVHQRVVGSIALAVYAALKGVSMLRVHDVDETQQALLMIDAVCQAG